MVFWDGCQVDRWRGTSVSEKHTASIFREITSYTPQSSSSLCKKAAGFSAMLVPLYQTTGCHTSSMLQESQISYLAIYTSFAIAGHNLGETECETCLISATQLCCDATTAVAKAAERFES